MPKLAQNQWKRLVFIFIHINRILTIKILFIRPFIYPHIFPYSVSKVRFGGFPTKGYGHR